MFVVAIVDVSLGRVRLRSRNENRALRRLQRLGRAVKFVTKALDVVERIDNE